MSDPTPVLLTESGPYRTARELLDTLRAWTLPSGPGGVEIPIATDGRPGLWLRLWQEADGRVLLEIMG